MVQYCVIVTCHTQSMAALRCLVLHQYPCAADSIFLSRIRITGAKALPQGGAFPSVPASRPGVTGPFHSQAQGRTDRSAPALCGSRTLFPERRFRRGSKLPLRGSAVILKPDKKLEKLFIAQGRQVFMRRRDARHVRHQRVKHAGFQIKHFI